MEKSLQIALLVASIIVLIIVLRYVFKNKLNIHYSMIWIVWSTAMILLSAFPSIMSKISKLLGIKVTSNAVFLISIFFLYCLTFYIYLALSKHNEQIINLNYEISVLRKKIEDLEKKSK